MCKAAEHGQVRRRLLGRVACLMTAVALEQAERGCSCC